MNAKFQSPSTIGFIICITLIVLAKLASRLIVLSSLYCLAGYQILAPVVVKFIKEQLGETSEPILSINYFSGLTPGITDEIRSEDLIKDLWSDDKPDLIGSQAHQNVDLIKTVNTKEVVESVLSALAKPKRGRKPKLDQENSTKIISKPKKLTKKEQAARDAWEDRQMSTDFQDQASWLGC